MWKSRMYIACKSDRKRERILLIIEGPRGAMCFCIFLLSEIIHRRDLTETSVRRFDFAHTRELRNKIERHR